MGALALALLCQDEWFRSVTVMVTPDGVGDILEIRVTDAAGSYGVSLSDPSGTTRRNTRVSPGFGVFFTYPADQSGVWTVSYGEPFPRNPVSAAVDIRLAPGGAKSFGSDGSCGLTGLEVWVLVLLGVGVRSLLRSAP